MKSPYLVLVAILCLFSAVTVLGDESHTMTNSAPTCGLEEGTYNFTIDDNDSLNDVGDKIVLNIGKQGYWTITNHLENNRNKIKFTASGWTFPVGGNCEIPVLFGNATQTNTHKNKHSIMVVGDNGWKDIFLFMSPEGHLHPMYSAEKDDFLHNGQSHGRQDD